MLPALSIFVFAQRYLVGGLVGAIWGLSTLRRDQGLSAASSNERPH
jgi:hypothetical protein